MAIISSSDPGCRTEWAGAHFFSLWAAETVVEQIRVVAGRVAASYGLDIFDVQFRREAPGMVLRVQLDRPGPAATAGR